MPAEQVQRRIDGARHLGPERSQRKCRERHEEPCPAPTLWRRSAQHQPTRRDGQRPESQDAADAREPRSRIEIEILGETNSRTPADAAEAAPVCRSVHRSVYTSGRSF
jgi:hypothetical protein